MRQHDTIARLREALQRHGCRVNSRTGLAKCKAEVERITGTPLSQIPGEMWDELLAFIAHKPHVPKPPVPFVPMVGYTKALIKRRELCEMTR